MMKNSFRDKGGTGEGRGMRSAREIFNQFHAKRRGVDV